MAPPPRPKRQRLSSSSNNASSSLDHLLESVFALSDSSVPFDLSLERLLESRVQQSEKEDLIHVAVRFGSALLDAASRSARKLATAHNSSVWPLPPELTVKVLSFLDTTSLCYVSATCTAFNKCACDPLCYANIDLTRNGPKVVNSVVSTMIQRAGKNLKSLKLGLGSHSPLMSTVLLTRSCLNALTSDNGASGALLQKLCLHYVINMETETLIFTLSNCKSLIDLEIVGIRNVHLASILTAVSDCCPLIERLCFDYTSFFQSQVLEVSDFKNVFKNCNMLSSLTIRGCKIRDYVLSQVIKGLSKLNYVDFSSSIYLEGFFLKDLGNGDDSLETLILRDCASLKENHIGEFLNAILAGKWKSLRLLDVYSQYRITCAVKLLRAVKQSRPDICLIGQFSPPKHIVLLSDTSSSSTSCTTSGDEQDMDSSSDDQVTQIGGQQNSDSSSDEQTTTQSGDEQNLDSSSDEEVTQNGDEPNSDSSSDDEI